MRTNLTKKCDHKTENALWPIDYSIMDLGMTTIDRTNWERSTVPTALIPKGEKAQGGIVEELVQDIVDEEEKDRQD
ncbi:unnamed protein product [Haemonchus placei]|uniref:Uncharacterized protein n=1 Tax=Haemonchus placei TaxID=6290 RepID=A0A0N4VT72_HAEPC|nr:unnamed protein product [Haemonchus placei]